MAQLIVRNVEEKVKTALQRRAKRHGHSMEEEVRSILRAAVYNSKKEPEKGLGTQIAELFEGIGITPEEEALFFSLRGQAPRPAVFDD